MTGTAGPRAGRIDYFAHGTCQWAFCNAGGTVTLDATRYQRRSHRTVTYIYQACPEHEAKVRGELEDEGYEVTVRDRREEIAR